MSSPSGPEHLPQSTDSEEGRAFLQGRLALLGKVVCLLGGGFYLFINATFWLGEGMPLLTVVTHPQSFYHALGTVLMGALWAIGRHARLSTPALRALDVGSMLLMMVLLALTGHNPATGLYRNEEVLLGATNVLLARAVLVPSAPRRTLGIGIAASILVALPAFVLGVERVGWPPGAPVLQVFTVLWCAVALALTTVTSSVIYGLRQEAKEARRLGQYTLLGRLGKGGMGEVYEARHAMLRRPTAIKLLPPDRAGGVNLQRFEREVQLTANLTHPNTIAVFDYGRTPDGLFYYAMELIDGPSLQELVETEGPQPPARVVHILRQAAASLAEAHARGLIHRDIKPANVLLGVRGGIPDFVKVVDFGLAKDLGGGEAQLSQADTLTGTPLYLAPEAIRAPDEVDARTDLYALGGVAYFLLAGAPMFTGSILEVCGHHLHTQPMPPSLRLGKLLPKPLEDLVLRCLEKDPARRPQDAAEMLALLEACPADADFRESDARSSWERWKTGVRSPRHGEAIETARTIEVDAARRAALTGGPPRAGA